MTWFYVRALRQRGAKIHVVTQVRNREALVDAGLTEGEDFTAIDTEPVARPLWRVCQLIRGGKGKGWTTVMALNALAHYYFEHLTWRRFKQDLHDGSFNVVHRITPLSPTVPSPLSRRCRAIGIPFILGPMNGGLPWPRQFRAVQAKEREWLSSVRWVSRLMPYSRSTFRDAAAVISGSRDTWNQLQSRVRHEHLYMPRNGVDTDQFQFSTRPGTLSTAEPIRLLFVGRLVPYKGCHLVLEAVRELLQAKAVTLTIVGDGPQRPELESMVYREQYQGVEFVGDVPHRQVQDWFSRSDVFVFPSIREFGGAVILEAMACGLPIVTVNYGGPAELAADDCGVLVPLESAEQIVRDVRQAVEAYASDRALLDSHGRQARERAEVHFDWRSKADRLLEIYHEFGGFELPQTPADAPAGSMNRQ